MDDEKPVDGAEIESLYTTRIAETMNGGSNMESCPDQAPEVVYSDSTNKGEGCHADGDSNPIAQSMPKDEQVLPTSENSTAANVSGKPVIHINTDSSGKQISSNSAECGLAEDLAMPSMNNSDSNNKASPKALYSWSVKPARENSNTDKDNMLPDGSTCHQGGGDRDIDLDGAGTSERTCMNMDTQQPSGENEITHIRDIGLDQDMKPVEVPLNTVAIAKRHGDGTDVSSNNDNIPMACDDDLIRCEDINLKVTDVSDRTHPASGSDSHRSKCMVNESDLTDQKIEVSTAMQRSEESKLVTGSVDGDKSATVQTTSLEPSNTTTSDATAPADIGSVVTTTSAVQQLFSAYRGLSDEEDPASDSSTSTSDSDTAKADAESRCFLTYYFNSNNH